MDRNRHMATRTPGLLAHNPGVATATIPMPGRLPVSYRDRALRLNIDDIPLNEVRTGTVVTAEGVITTVRHLDRNALGRTMIVLTGDDGNSAHVLFSADTVRQVAPALTQHTRIKLHGLVSRSIPGLPVGLEGFGVRVVSV